jgi:hypothetical protein
VTAYNGFTSGSNTAFLPMLFKHQFGYESAFYVQNLNNSTPANITITFRDATNGAQNCTLNDTIGPYASKGYWLPPLTCTSGSLPSSWYGAAVITSDQPIVAVGRPHIGTQVTTYNGFNSGSTISYVPMLFKNQWNYNAALYVQNTNGSNTANVTITFRDIDGNQVCTVNDTIGAYASKGYWMPAQTCNTGSLPTSWYGSAIVTSDQPVVTVARPHLTDQVTAYDGFADGTNLSYLPLLYLNQGGNEAAVYIQNLDYSETTNITLSFYDTTGNLICSKTDTISALSSKGYWLKALVCDP